MSANYNIKHPSYGFDFIGYINYTYPSIKGTSLSTERPTNGWLLSVTARTIIRIITKTTAVTDPPMIHFFLAVNTFHFLLTFKLYMYYIYRFSLCLKLTFITWLRRIGFITNSKDKLNCHLSCRLCSVLLTSHVRAKPILKIYRHCERAVWVYG